MTEHPLEIRSRSRQCLRMPVDNLDNARITAVLGPTNTGKTHYAMSRMLGHSSGMIGFPLRLLARENYDRAVAAKGAAQVALITGEEKIVPKDARWFLCTVEAMPLDREVSFLGIDEIQMCADPDRGHVFTDRLLYARGRTETMFMGAETIRPLMEHLVPEAEIVTRPRMSVLTHVGPRKVSRLPRRSAVVAFTASDVYALAELIRRQRGGAAVVLGALSPRTRNAQVEMYQNGDVDYLVATDAIGMGLNMDVDHVAFAALKKFDGRRVRNLDPSELAQAAGRAGRHMNDGTFGTTAEAGVLDDDVAGRIEEHRFNPLTHIYWRNEDIDLSSVSALQRSLRVYPRDPGLQRARRADDEVILDRLAKEKDVIDRAIAPQDVQLLWDICRVPDFRGVMSDAHANLALSLYRYLSSDEGTLPVDMIAANVKRLDRIDGDIDTLIGRIAGIRTWTYVSFRGDWTPDALHWQEKTRAIEDKLSDALHERLTQRFVDRKTSVLVAKLKDQQDLVAAVRTTGEVLIEGEPVGHLRGLRFSFDGAVEGDAGRAVANAAFRALRPQIAFAAGEIDTCGDDAISLAESVDGSLPYLAWRDAPLARLKSGNDPMRPDVQVLADDTLQMVDRARIEARLQKWLQTRLFYVFSALFSLRNAELNGPARGLAFQLSEGFGSLRRRDAKAQIDALSREDRRALRTHGVRLGRDMAYIPALLKPEAIMWRALLWSLKEDLHKVPALPPPGRVSVPVDRETNATFLEHCGYRVLGPLAVRIDMAERLSSKAWSMAKGGPFSPTADLTSMIGASNEQLPRVMKALGFKRIQRKNAEGAMEDRYVPVRAGKPAARSHKQRNRPVERQADPHSPFAALKHLASGD